MAQVQAGGGRSKLVGIDGEPGGVVLSFCVHGSSFTRARGCGGKPQIGWNGPYMHFQDVGIYVGYGAENVKLCNDFNG